MTARRTPWYPGDVKPLKDRPGPYERLDNRYVYCDYWDGWHWLYGKDGIRSFNQSLPWRGLTEQTKEK